MSADDLLPPNATPLERALARFGGERLAALPAPHRALWDAERCPAPLLPWLAWAVSVDLWLDHWSEAQRRAAIADAIAMHRLRGTPGAVKRRLQQLGFKDVEIMEGSSIRRDGTYTRDGSIHRGGDIGPYQFDVALNTATASLPELAGELFGGTPEEPGEGEVLGGTPDDPGEDVITGGTPADTAALLGELTPQIIAAINLAIDQAKNERSKLRYIWSYRLFRDGAFRRDGTKRRNGGLAR